VEFITMVPLCTLPRRLALDGGVVLLADVEARDGRDVDGRRQVVDHGVDHHLHALVLEGGAADDGDELEVDGAVPQRAVQHHVGDLGALALEVQGHDLVVDVGAGLDQLVVPLLGDLLEGLGDVDPVELLALRLVVEDGRLHLDEIDDALVLIFLAQGPLDGHGVGAQAFLHAVYTHEEVGAHLVHLVHERDAGDLVLVGLAPDRLALRLHAVAAVEHRHRAVEHAQRPLDLDGEVDVAGGVDDVDAVADAGVRALDGAPETVRRGRRDRDPALLLLDHVIHGRRALVDLADLVVDARVVEDPLGGRGLPRIDVRHDADVARSLERVFACHGGAPFDGG
jgi:hypothetical protein